jgi:hypothetical protein
MPATTKPRAERGRDLSRPIGNEVRSAANVCRGAARRPRDERASCSACAQEFVRDALFSQCPCRGLRARRRARGPGRRAEGLDVGDGHTKICTPNSYHIRPANDRSYAAPQGSFQHVVAILRDPDDMMPMVKNGVI